MQSKAILLNDMLNNAKEGERIGLEGDVYEQVAAACRGARPKIQKWIEQDTGERADMMGESSCGAVVKTGLNCETACCCATTLSTTLWSGTRRSKRGIGKRPNESSMRKS